MLNIIYNKFAKLFIDRENDDPIDLTTPNTYKMALFNDSYEVDVDCIDSFYDLQLTNRFEVQDSNESYEEGGKYVTFTSMDRDNEADTTLKYTIGLVRWKNTKISNAKYAIIYREDDGLLISCHDFNRVISTDDEDISLDWKDVPTLIITSQAEDDIYEVDQDLNLISLNGVANRTLSNVFKDLGVIFTDDLGDDEDAYPKEIPSVLPEDRTEDWLNSMSYMTTLKNEDVNNIFDEIMSEGSNG